MVDNTSFDIVNAQVTFKNVPLHILSKFAFKDTIEACKKFKEVPDVKGCIIIQTASRVEIFASSSSTINGDEQSHDVRKPSTKNVITDIKNTWIELSSLEQIDIDHFDQIIEIYKGDDVYRSLLRLASGLDSVVVGKQEIYDEIVQAADTAKNEGLSDKVLDTIFETIIRLAGRIRESTEISKNVLSLGDVAIRLVDEKAGIDSKKKVLLIGTSEHAAMIAKSLNKRNISFDVASRTLERATGFTSLLGGNPVEFDVVLTGFDKYDIILVATTSDYFLITYERIRLVMEDKKKGTLVLDLSDPRTVDEGITALPGIKLLFRDQIYEIYKENATAKESIIPAVEKIIDKELPIITSKMTKIDS